MIQLSLPIGIDFMKFESAVYNEYFSHSIKWCLYKNEVQYPFPPDSLISLFETSPGEFSQRHKRHSAQLKSNIILWLKSYNQIKGNSEARFNYKDATLKRLEEVYYFVIAPKQLYLNACVRELEIEFGSMQGMKDHSLKEFPHNTNMLFLQKLDLYYRVAELNNFKKGNCLINKLQIKSR